MSYLAKMKVGKYTYIYEVTGFRDANGKSRNKKHPVGKIDPVSGAAIYKPEYIARMLAAGTPITIAPTKIPPNTFSINDIKNSTIKEYGAYYFLSAIAESIGLKTILRETATAYWAELLTLAIYLIYTEEPFMYCAHWIETTETQPVGDLSSQRISELLHAIRPLDRDNFYQRWGQYRSEREYLALDITSISSWSQLIEDVEWGYNRDGDKLAQINLCLLMGEQSKLPIFQTIYSGSLKDVSTLQTTIEETMCYIKGKAMLLVMDKGFYSKKNVDLLLSNPVEYQFIMPVSFTSAYAKNLIIQEKKTIDNISNTIVSGTNSVRAVTRTLEWKIGKEDSKTLLYAHIYFNALKAAMKKEELYTHVAMLKQAAKENPKNEKLQNEFKTFLDIRPSANDAANYSVQIRHDVLEKKLQTTGWLVLISNKISDSQEALSIYRAKDVVEKGFLRLKRVHQNIWCKRYNFGIL
ncbi:IS4 family transposase [Spirochaetia bacterium]|nr:IS4 family transposase [Spirochaetia bacterium]